MEPCRGLHQAGRAPGHRHWRRRLPGLPTTAAAAYHFVSTWRSSGGSQGPKDIVAWPRQVQGAAGPRVWLGPPPCLKKGPQHGHRRLTAAATGHTGPPRATHTTSAPPNTITSYLLPHRFTICAHTLVKGTVTVKRHFATESHTGPQPLATADGLLRRRAAPRPPPPGPSCQTPARRSSHLPFISQ